MDINLDIGEEVRGIEGFPGYFVTSFGNVWSSPKRGNHYRWCSLKPHVDKITGYAHVTICSNSGYLTKQVHDLVGRAFNPFDDDPAKEWCHRPDPTKTNNRSDNLVWDYHRKNVWEREIALNPEWGVNIYIYEQGEHLRLPFYIKLPIKGKMVGMGRMFATREEARIERDRLCVERGIEIP